MQLDSADGMEREETRDHFLMNDRLRNPKLIHLCYTKPNMSKFLNNTKIVPTFKREEKHNLQSQIENANVKY